MTIKEAEERTGLSRSAIRFYEKAHLIEPLRNDKNGYRDYSETDIERIKKIAYLRTLEISVEDISHIIFGKESFPEMIEKQTIALKKQIKGLNNAKDACEKILADKHFIFLYPFLCIMIPAVLKPILCVKVLRNCPCRDLLTEYLSNSLCFIALSVEIFSILFVQGLVKNIAVVLFLNTAALIGIPMIGIIKMNPLYRPMLRK